MSAGRRTPKAPRIPWMKLPKLVCPTCGVEFVIEDNRWPKHNVGDAPDWWEEPVCGLSEKLVQRRQPKRKTWVAKYLTKRSGGKP